MNKFFLTTLLVAFLFVTSFHATASDFLFFNRLNIKNWIKKTSPVIADSTLTWDEGAVVGGKTGTELSKYMLKQAERFKSIHHVTVSTIRQGEVIKVSYPSFLLFEQNDSVLASFAEQNLRPILTFLHKGYTRMIIVGHSDNTGSKEYITRISSQRAENVENWFLKEGISKKNISLHSLGDSQPLYENDCYQNRALNRRVTIYLVPNEEMIRLAKKKRLN